MNLEDYELGKSVYQGRSSIIYRARRKRDGLPVIIKLPASEYPSPREIARFKHEYRLLIGINSPFVNRVLALEKYMNAYAIIEEDFKGRSLLDRVNEEKLPIGLFLELATKIVDGLSAVHQYGIIHKDLKPSNILVNLETDEVKIIDFATSTLIPREKQSYKNPELLEGTLAYMSPEQTGRMNRLIDYRTDLYSLGATFYHLVTGRPPFEAANPMELVHCHLARTPEAAHKIFAHIPVAISEIILKLLEKNAENRYQGTYGLRLDLETCRQHWNQHKHIPSFQLGGRDISNKFRISQKLYGRDLEVATLLAAFERVCTGATEQVMVNGYSGIGKSSVVHEIHKPIAARNGFFIYGKFDQFKRGIPYDSLLQSFQQLVTQILTEPPEKIAVWRDTLNRALQPNAQVLLSVLPDLKLIIGEQPAVLELGPTESENRFIMIIEKFIGVFANKDHPLVIFLDDLQWSDLPTLKLIKLLATDRQQAALFLIGAYRDNEVGSSHPLTDIISDMGKMGVVIPTLHLDPLKSADVELLVASSLLRSPEETRDLSRLLYAKTDGNPFFLTQLLESLYQDNRISLNLDSGCWEWDLESIQTVGITHNVVDLMTAKIRKLPETCQRVLELASCIGNVFELSVLAIIREKDKTETQDELWQAVVEGLILVEDNLFKFLHDRVQQASHKLIPQKEQGRLHLKIGRLLLENTPESDIGEKLFDIVNHMNMGSNLIENPAELKKLAELNLVAGKKAKQATAYQAGLDYIMTGSGYLTEKHWDSDYALMLELTREQAECEALSSQFEICAETFDRAVTHAEGKLDKIRLFTMQLPLFIREGTNLQRTITLAGVGGLCLFDEAFDVENLPQHLRAERESTERNLARILTLREVSSLIDLPEMVDETQLAYMQHLVNLWSCAYVAGLPDLVIYCGYRMINLILENGVSNVSSFGFMAYAWQLSMRDRYKQAYAFGKLGLALEDKYNNLVLTSRVYAYFAHAVSSYRTHYRENLPVYAKAREVGFESGDILHVVWISIHTIWSHILNATPIKEIHETIKKYHAFFEQHKDGNMHEILKLQEHALLNLQGKSLASLTLSDDTFCEKTSIDHLLSNNFYVGMNWYYLLITMVHYYNQNYREALATGLEAKKTMAFNPGLFSCTQHYFYFALTITALHPQFTESERETYWPILLKYREKFEMWAEDCPINFAHKLALINAEIAKIEGETLRAMDYYETAVREADRHEFLHHSALTRERYGVFHHERGVDEIATILFREACFRYGIWGAEGPQNRLREQFLPVTRAVSPDMAEFSMSSLSSGSMSNDLIDFETVIKASQAISGVIEIDDLIRHLLHYLLENAGARKGYLLLERAGSLIIEAEGAVGEEIKLTRVPADPEHLSSAMVRLVQRTRVNLVLDNALEDSRFQEDAYVKANQVKSVLCMPIMNQGNISAILYFENNLTVGAFTPRRMKVLQLISTQVAISFENAVLYANLQEKVRERTRELEEKNEALVRAQDQLVMNEKMSTLGTLTAGVAHEFNNPNNFIHASTDQLITVHEDFFKLLVELVGDPEEASSVFDTWFERLTKLTGLVMEGSKRISEIVKNLRCFTRLDEAALKNVNILAGLRATVMFLQSQFENVSFNLELDDAIEIDCWPAELNQVYLNLVLNSCQAIRDRRRSDEKAPGLINIRNKREQEWIILIFEDTGQGIAEENMDKIFDAFFTTREPGQGPGLGLYAAWRVMEKHGGRIVASSERGVGSVFTLYLPVARLNV